MQEQLFRKKALERLSSPEQLDQLMQVTNARGWLALIALAAVLITAVFWSVLGSIPTKVTGQGILIRTGGIYEVVTMGGGQVTEINVQPGDDIAKGQIVARVAEPGLLNSIKTAEAELASLQAQHADPQITANDQKSADLQKRIQVLKNQLEATSMVVSQQAGRILEIRTDVGKIVAVGTTLLTLESTNSALEALFFIPPAEGKKVHVGMEAYVAPTTVKKEEFGLMDATVKSVSSFPSSSQAMMRVLGNDSLVQTLSANGAPFAVHAALIPDLKTESGYKWSSAGGPPLKIYSGTLCTGLVTVRKQRPITLLIPYIREKLGV